MSEKLNIYQKLIEVRKSVDYLKKDSKMELPSGGGGKSAIMYNASSQVLASIREAMNAQGLMLIPSITSARVVSEYKGTQTMTELVLTYRIVNAENPTESVELGWYGQGTDQGEKGVGKAMTYAEKFLILKLFNIPTDKDDPDKFSSNHSDDKPAAPSKADPSPPHAPALKNVSRASVDALVCDIGAATEVGAKEIEEWRAKIKSWPPEYVKEIGAAVNAAKARVGQ